MPHWFHAASAGGTLILELGLVWMLFLPRRIRIICFFIVTPWEIGVILTANYTFLNYLVLSLGFLLLDDRFLWQFAPGRLRKANREVARFEVEQGSPEVDGANTASDLEIGERKRLWSGRSIGNTLHAIRLAFAVVMLTLIFYNTTEEMLLIPFRALPLPTRPIALLEPFRISNQYGLFAVMTNGRYEIEFQGSNDGQNWTPYLFRNKPQVLNEAPGVYAPYQPRFDWNLWFASLGDWHQNEIIPLIEERLLENDADVLHLFRGNPFPQTPPRYVRAVLWQYWFTSRAEKRATGNWWRHELLGLYAPELEKNAEGKTAVVEWPGDLPVHD